MVGVLTVDEIIGSSLESHGDDWAFWVYVCEDELDEGAQEDETRGPSPSCARAIYLPHREVGLAWSPARARDRVQPPRWISPVFEDFVCHWIELLYDGVTKYRHLGCLVDGGRAWLPAPEVASSADEPADPWVSRQAYLLFRLANEVDPDCRDFATYFERSGIALR